MAIGGSVAVDGVCLTATEKLSPTRVRFDVMHQSLLVTTLGSTSSGFQVNVERAARDGAEIGGHPLSGHVDFSAKIGRINKFGNNCSMRIEVPPVWKRYIFPKGYIALNGTSLTVSEVNREESWFEIWLIPETRRVTNFEGKAVGDMINIEIERGTQVVVDTVRATLEEKLGVLLPALEDLLKKNGVDINSLAGRVSVPETEKKKIS
ncbi:MAG TPA: riboflavin synthase subunit alpha [Collimonas sp.]|nr:riboflavin synthase subunit alpha [Collimonas sp.]HWW04252.1 riboflavin synthase subunit alpha [Collimonas sp.]